MQAGDLGAGSGGAIAFVPAKWPLANPFPPAAAPSPSRRWRRPAAALLFLAGSALAFVSAYAESRRPPAAAPVANASPDLPDVAADAPPADGEDEGTTLLVGLRAGEPLERAMARAGVGAGEAIAVRRALQDAIFAADPAPGAQLRVRLGDPPSFLSARPLQSIRFESASGATVVAARAGRHFAVAAEGLTPAQLPRRVDGAVGGDLLQSLRGAGLTAAVAEAFLRAVATRLPLRALAPQDRFTAVVTPAGELALVRIDRGDGRELALLRWASDDGRKQWLDTKGAASATGTVQRPVQGPVTSRFGMRLHPILGFWRVHKGVDYRAPIGTPILAPMDGRVSAAGWQGGYGRQVRLDHAGGLVTTYSHMSAIAVSPGAQVRQGDVLGYVGSSGLSTGPHLHYEAYRGGVAVDPLSIGRPAPARLAGEELARLRARMRQLLALRPGPGAAAARSVSAADDGTRLRL